MINLKEIIENIDNVIESNNNLVKKGSADSLSVKYFYITKDMSEYIQSIVTHNKDNLLSSIKEKKSINIIDLFAGGAIFTLLFSKYLLEIILENKINVTSFSIKLNDKMYSNTKIINWKNLEKNFTEIIKVLKSKSFIQLSNYDLSKKDNMIQNIINNYDLNIVIANPMFLSISKGKEHYKEIVFLNEDSFLQNEGIQEIFTNLIPKVDYFIYLTKQQKYNLKLESHKNEMIYINEYSKLAITENDKKRYEIFQNSREELKNMMDEDFWKFTNSQKENYNTIILFSKGNSIKKTYRYVYKNILDNKNQRLLEGKIKKVKTLLGNITLEDTMAKYENLRGLL